ncbi:hypothetical protein Anas_03248 [Armadillidium nasatum]|uniref:Uncharacterized protein n=1 Tax=Armadillidium nasatum TaxID=96803 RepID=A0A5N5SVS9_9CRUS|nr:hypothetical protein Anas_03248 [Armadillidium nasatum]
MSHSDNICRKSCSIQFRQASSCH